MYVIKFDRNDIYAGLWSNLDGYYCYNSDFSNKKKPKVFKTKKGAENHIMSLIDKVPYPEEHGFRIEEWTDEDLENHLKSIGRDPFEGKINKQNSKVEKYWKNVFKPIKGEVEVTQIKIENNICIVTYLMPYSLYENEFYFQADLNKEIVINAFCDAVIENGELMCQQIKESIFGLKEMFK